MAMRLEVSGYRELAAELDQMRAAVRADATRGAVREAAAVMTEAMREKAPELDKTTARSTALPPGALKTGMTFRVRNIGSGLIMAIIGPRKGTGRAAHLVEYGHRLVKGGKSRIGPTGPRGPGKEIGEVPAHPFLRPAFEVSYQATLDAFVAGLRKRLERWVS